MHDFLLKEISNTNIEKELEIIGFDKSYRHKAKDKLLSFMTLGFTEAPGTLQSEN